MQQSQSAAIAAYFQPFLQLRDSLRPIMSSRRRQREVSKRLRAIHDVTPRLQGFKATLKGLRFCCVRLRQQTKKVVERLTMIGIHFNHFAPTLNRSGTIPIAQRSLSQHKERVGIACIDSNGPSE